MSTQENNNRASRTRRGIFWPLILIGIGVIFLLKNTGVISGDVINTLTPYWPVVLILMGFDSVYRREGWIGATLVIALGVVFLLSNLGYLGLGVWQVLLRLWPLFLVAAGLDLLIGRRSWFGSLLGLLVILAILIGSLWLMSGGVLSAQPITTSQFDQALDGAYQASVEISQDAGILRLSGLEDQEKLLVGSGPSGDGISLTRDYQVVDGKGVLVLRSKGEPVTMVSTHQAAYEYKLNSVIPIDLNVEQGAGQIDLNLADIYISQLDVDQAVGQTQITLSDTGSFTGIVDGAIGQVTLIVPADVGLKISAGTALVVVQAPPDFQETNKVYTSPNYDQAQTKIELMVNLAIGTLNVVIQ